MLYLLAAVDSQTKMGKEIPPVDVEYVVVAQLIDKQSCPNSALILYGLVMKYKVVKVLKGAFKADEDIFYVVHGAPELPRNEYYKFCGTLRSFVVGETHRLRLKTKLKYNSSPFDLVVDPYESCDGDRYLCLTADPYFGDSQNGHT